MADEVTGTAAMVSATTLARTKMDLANFIFLLPATLGFRPVRLGEAQ
jgi:hypothetical protein